MAEQIPITQLIPGRWYVGRGRRGNVGLWDGTRFLTIAEKFGELVIKGEPYYTEETGTFQPFALVDEGVMVEPFGRVAWDAHYGRRMEFGVAPEEGAARGTTTPAVAFTSDLLGVDQEDDTTEASSRHEVSPANLFVRHCTSDAVEILSQTLKRHSARQLFLDPPTTICLTLWTILRWEKKVAVGALRSIGTDLWDLQRRLDDVLEQPTRTTRCPKGQLQAERARSYATGVAALEQLLGQAEREAKAMGHTWIGTEHLLLAILSEPGSRLAPVLQEFAVVHGTVKEAVNVVLRCK